MVGTQAMPPAPRAPVFTRLATLALAAALLAVPASAEPRHGLSAFGELKYPADFKNFEYVNPDAPKGGRFSSTGTGGVKTFDSFNNFILKGDAAQGLEYLFDGLMTRAQDEPDAVYGLVAESADATRFGQRRADLRLDMVLVPRLELHLGVEPVDQPGELHQPFIGPAVGRRLFP